jgi:hypothetical protein
MSLTERRSKRVQLIRLSLSTDKVNFENQTLAILDCHFFKKLQQKLSLTNLKHHNRIELREQSFLRGFRQW